MLKSLVGRGVWVAITAWLFVAGCGNDGGSGSSGGAGGAAGRAGKGGGAGFAAAGTAGARGGTGGAAAMGGGSSREGGAAGEGGAPGSGGASGRGGRGNAGRGGNAPAGAGGRGGSAGTGATGGDVSNEPAGAGGEAGQTDDSGGQGPAPAGGSAGATAGTSSGVSGNGGLAGGAGSTANGGTANGGTANGGVANGGVANGGVANGGTGATCASNSDHASLDTDCVAASDCDAKIGPRGCGAWQCTSGQCQAQIRCEDADGDGFFTGPDCACTGRPLDCDDGDNAVGASSSASCCNGGTRACTAGIWGLCSGATGETCDGADNDCDGVPDNLGEISCGLGACKKTIAACTNGVLGVCVPDAPATTVDGCNGIDDDCDGTIDEDCPTCIHVAPDGDDAAALGNDAVTPFATVQAALDFADAHRSVAHRVCVAAGSACGATTTYAGPSDHDLTMYEGISLLANYESSCWTHCDDSTTHLAPGTSRGVVFPADIAVQTELDGFTIDRPYDATLVSGVTVDGAHGAWLSHLTIVGGTYNPAGTPAVSTGSAYGVDVENGSATVVESRVDGGLAFDTAAIHANAALVLLEDNCSVAQDGQTGRCPTACGTSGPGFFAGHFANEAGEYAVDLEDSPGSRVERSDVCAYGQSQTFSDQAGIRVTGASSGVVVRANAIGGDFYTQSGDRTASGISLTECNDAAPWVVDNQTVGVNAHSNGQPAAVHAVGACHPVIEANHQIANTVSAVSGSATGVLCEASSAPSRCVVYANPNVTNSWAPVASSGAPAVGGTGVGCQGGSCARIENNVITSLGGPGWPSQCNTCISLSTGVSLSGGETLLRGNTIAIGSLQGKFSGLSVSGTTLSNVENNGLAGGFSGAAALFDSNFVSQANCGPDDPSPCPAVTWSGGGTVSNNCIVGAETRYGSDGSTLMYFPAFVENGTSADPSAFVNNDLYTGSGFIGDNGLPGYNSALYVNEGTTKLTSAAQVNALTDMTVSGTTETACTAAPSAH